MDCIKALTSLLEGATTGAIGAAEAEGAKGAGGGSGGAGDGEAGEGSASEGGEGAAAAAEVGLGRILPKSCWAMLARAALDCVISSSLLSLSLFSLISSQSSSRDEGAVL